MDQNNPYEAPGAKVYDVSADADGVDETGPFSPSGRFGRLSYLAWTTLVNLVITVVTLGIAGGVGALQQDPTSSFTLGSSIGMIVLQVAFVVVAVLFSIRRLHDFGASGWWSVSVIVPIINIIPILVFFLKPGNLGANRFGPPRITRGWEKVVGYIAIGLIVLGIIGMLAAIIIPMVAQ